MDIVTSGAVTSGRRTSVTSCAARTAARSGGEMTGTSSGDCGSQQLEFAVVTEASEASEASSEARSRQRWLACLGGA